MTTAVVVPGLDPSGTPALFSRAVVTGLLRERLQFQGVIVTDGLGMGGITTLYGLPDATVAAVRAGNDLVLLNSADAAYQAAAIEAVKQQVNAGGIPMDQVQASVARGRPIASVIFSPPAGAISGRSHRPEPLLSWTHQPSFHIADLVAPR